MDQLCLVQPVDGLSQRIVVAVAATADCQVRLLLTPQALSLKRPYLLR